MIIDDNSASESLASNTMRRGGNTRGRDTARGRGTRGRHDNGIFMVKYVLWILLNNHR